MSKKLNPAEQKRLNRLKTLKKMYSYNQDIVKSLNDQILKLKTL